MHNKQTTIFVACWMMMWIIAIVIALVFPEKAKAVESMFSGLEIARDTLTAYKIDSIEKLFAL